MERFTVKPVVQQSAAFDEDIELHVIVGHVTVSAFEHAAFATAVSTGEENAFELRGWDKCAHAFTDSTADLCKVLLKSIAPVKREAEGCCRFFPQSRRVACGSRRSCFRRPDVQT